MNLKGALPPTRDHEAIYEKMSTSERHAFNPFDLQLGAKRPTAVDSGFLQDFIELLATPKNFEKPTLLMAELITEVIEAAYERSLNKETAKEYKSNTNSDVDRILNLYPEANDFERKKEVWGLRKTWLKVRDFLFLKGHSREALIAQRYVVPLLPDLASVINQTPNILQRFNKAAPNGIPLVDEFQTLMSAAAKNYPLLTKPTVVDFDSSSYIVFDLNDVTQQEGSQQTNVMYSLTAQLGTKDYWFNIEDLPIIEPMYKKFNEEKIEFIREASLGVTFEEFRRTGGSPKLRSMINRWMAEGRKWGVRVQLVMQQALHADAEMFGHATVITLMGTWNKETINQLKKRVELTAAEEFALMEGIVHGPRAGGASMIIKYLLKDSGWGSQLLYLTKSVNELWSSSTTVEDVILKEHVEEIIGEANLANEILCTRFKKGSAVQDIQKQKKLAKLNESDAENIYEKLAKNAIKTWQIMNGKAG
jgi:intracellular multiplication protein IcmB